VEALDGMATRIAIPEIVQFVDGLAVSMTRGTPLAEVLRSQAADVREQSRRRLLELSGRKEIGMLIPVVVFVLPVTVIFAVFPSLTVLDLRPWSPRSPRPHHPRRRRDHVPSVQLPTHPARARAGRGRAQSPRREDQHRGDRPRSRS